MQKLMVRYFGEEANSFIYREADGQTWVSARDLCDAMGISCVYHAVEDQLTRTELNLTEADKQKFYEPAIKTTCKVWFVSETGFWKILGRSRSSFAESFRADYFTQVLPVVLRHKTNIRSSEEN